MLQPGACPKLEYLYRLYTRYLNYSDKRNQLGTNGHNLYTIDI